MITNRIVTRGFGPSRGVPGRAGPVTRGYGGVVPEFVPEAIQRAIVKGKSGKKRYLDELEEVIIWAKLIEVNGYSPKKEIKGATRVQIKKSNTKVFAESISSKTRNILDRIKVSIKRIK